jgi:asparagine synthase (glutamine-hydrolysing)
VIRPVVRQIPEAQGYKRFSQKVRWLDEVTSDRGGRLYARMTSFFRFSPERKATLYGPALASALQGVDALAAIAAPFDGAMGVSTLDRMLQADLRTRLPEHTLMLADRLSMSHGLEVRSPLLDVPLAEYCLGMPDRLRVRRGQTKVALREAAAGWIPQSLLERGKQGFMFPVAEWLNATTLPGVRAHLIEGPAVRAGWIRADAVEQLVREHGAQRADHHVRLWQLMSLDAWHRLFLDGSSPDEDATRLAHWISQ